MNICEYKVKPIFFLKVERFKKQRDMNIVVALSFLGLKKTAYYKAKETGKITKGIIKRILNNCYAKGIFTINDFEKIG